ncbi:hypothetical protein ACFC1I_00755 [Microbacterium sp. NPDC056044]|uniref:hypothetical protein n=1 Tax=Microbacterium sp. NPDC056044 TaxID=3345690 RepID=UPI0035DD1B47
MTHTHRRASSRALAIIAALVMVGGLLLATAPRASATIAESDSFDGWSANVSGAPDFVIRADTGTAHDGAASARIEFASAYSTKYVDLRQNIRANGGTTYAMSAWVRTENLSSSGAAYVVLSGDHSQRVELPAGTNDWTRLEWTYTQPAGSMTFVMRFLVRGTGTVWVDDVRMTAPGSATNLVINPSFESHNPPPGTLAFSDTALVYEVGEAEVGVTTIADSVAWDVRASSGQRIDSGSAAVTDDTARIDLSALPAGYYSVTLSVDAPVAATRTGTLAIVQPPSATQAESRRPVGVAVHVNRYSVDQVDALMAPLNAGVLREGPSWDTIETAPGVYEFPALFDAQLAAAKARGERPLVILAYFSRWYDGGKTPSSPEGIAAFASYAAAAAAHYGADVDYEIYNEFNHTFNNGACGMTAACYYDLLVPAAAAIHAAAPGARVVGPVSAGAKWDFMEELFALGALQHLDAVSYHTYDFPVAPEGRTEAGVATLRALIDEYAPGSGIPIWLSEHGWTTTTGGTTEQQQAAYVVRSAALLEAAGVERIVYYELIDSGHNPAEQEHNFGISRLPDDGGTALTPKPAYPALAVFNRLTAGRELTELHRLDGAMIADFTDAAGDVLRMLWATAQPMTFGVETSADARLTQGDGRSWQARSNGRIELTVGANPVFLSGAVATPALVADPAVVIATPDRIALNGAPAVPVHVDRAALAITGDVSVSGPVGGTTVLSGDDAAVEGTTTLAPLRELGTRPLAYTVHADDGVVAFVDDVAQVVENPVLAVGPAVGSAPGAGPHLALTMQNLAGAGEATVADVSYTVGPATGALPPTTLAEGEARSVGIDSPGLAPWQPYPFTVTASTPSGGRTLTGTTALAAIPAEPATPVDVPWRDRASYVTIAGGSPDPDDLGGTFALSWSPDGLRVRSAVTDQDHSAAASIDRLWSGDSLQFAVARGIPGADPQSRVELGAYLGADGAGVYRYTAPVGVVDDATAVVTRTGTTTSYDLTVPWEVLGIDPRDGAFSFSILVNDNDGGVREGFYEWGSGIGSAKNASLFVPVLPLVTDGAAVEASVQGLCVGKRPLWAVKVRNAGDARSDLSVQSGFAEAERSSVPAGAAAVLRLRSTDPEIAAGSVRVTAYVPGTDAAPAGSYATVDVAAPAVACDD